MTPYSANPSSYIFSAVAIGAVLLYLLYSAVDRLGLEVRTAQAIVTGKQLNPGGKSYYTTIAAGRSWVQSQETPETYAVTLNVDGERAVGLVTKSLYESLQANAPVQVKIRRTRITKRLEVVEVAHAV